MRPGASKGTPRNGRYRRIRHEERAFGQRSGRRAPRRGRRRRPVGLLRGRAAARRGLRGRPARPAADAVRPRARGRGARPPEDQVRHARVREDRAAQAGFRFFGGIALGDDVSRAELLERYHAVVYAIGTADDNRLGIPGEDRPGLALRHALRRLVQRPSRRVPTRRSTSPRSAPSSSATATSRSTSRGCSCSTPTSSRPTDTADHAIEAFAARRRREVVLLGRRGPAQAAFTNPELRELGELAARRRRGRPRRARARRATRRTGSRPRRDATAKRNVEILRELRAARAPTARDAPDRAALPALAGRDPRRGRGRPRSPACASCATGSSADDDGRLRAVPTGEEEVIPCGLVLRSIGYRGRPRRRRPVRRAPRPHPQRPAAACATRTASRCPGEYVVGWIKRGPSGVIGTNKKDAADTVARIVEDAEAGRLPDPARPPTPTAVGAWLRERAPGVVDWDGWEAIDEHERGARRARRPPARQARPPGRAGRGGAVRRRRRPLGKALANAAIAADHGLRLLELRAVARRRRRAARPGPRTRASIRSIWSSVP